MTEVTQDVPPQAADAHNESAPLTFADMRMKVGDRMQLEPRANVGGDKCVVRLIGYIEGDRLLVTLPRSAQWAAPLIEGDEVLMRTFSGNAAYAFGCYVDYVAKRPFDHLHLTFPKTISGKRIRSSRRIRTNIPARIEPTGTEATIANLSATGAELVIPQFFGETGSILELTFLLPLNEVSQTLRMTGLVRAVRPSEDADGPVRCGIEFTQITAAHRMALQSYVYFELVEHPVNEA